MRIASGRRTLVPTQTLQVQRPDRSKAGIDDRRYESKEVTQVDRGCVDEVAANNQNSDTAPPLLASALDLEDGNIRLRCNLVDFPQHRLSDGAKCLRHEGAIEEEVSS